VKNFKFVDFLRNAVDLDDDAFGMIMVDLPLFLMLDGVDVSSLSLDKTLDRHIDNLPKWLLDIGDFNTDADPSYDDVISATWAVCKDFLDDLVNDAKVTSGDVIMMSAPTSLLFFKKDGVLLGVLDELPENGRLKIKAMDKSIENYDEDFRAILNDKDSIALMLNYWKGRVGTYDKKGRARDTSKLN